MKPVGVKLATCIDYGVEHNEKHLKLKVANVRIFSKCYTPLQIGLRRYRILKKRKWWYHGLILLGTSTVKNFFQYFMGKFKNTG